MSTGERPRTWQQAERRALVADLLRTQATLRARTEQLEQIFASRWYRLARLFWRLRRGAIFRRPSPPRLAGEDSFARSLNGDPVTGGTQEVRLVPAPKSHRVGVDEERVRWLAGETTARLEELRIAAILDEGMEACLGPECDLDTGFGAADWRERLEANPPHMLLAEAALAGNGGGWAGAVSAHPGSPQAGLPALRALIAWCRERGIPTAFWATRDPFGFERFAEAASLFDHVFTVDADLVPAHRQLPGGSPRTVAALPPAAQPRLHNPIGGSTGRGRSLGFADPHGDGPPSEARKGLLEAAAPFDLTIYPHPTPAAYKRHSLFLSVCPTTTSATALPRHVFELLACGTPVLSTAGAAVTQLLGELVPVLNGSGETRETIERLLDEDALRADLARRGQRHVLAAHTYRDRLAELVTAVGFDVAAGGAEATAVLLPVGSAAELGEAVDSLLEQSLAPDEVLIGLGEGRAGERELERLAERFPGTRLRTLDQAGQPRGSERLRELARLAASPWVAPMAPSLRYDRDHLRDLVACARFADAQAIGFSPPGSGDSHRYAEAIPPHAALARRELVAERGWPRDEEAMRGWFAQGVRIYAGDRLAGGPREETDQLAGGAKDSA